MPNISITNVILTVFVVLISANVGGYFVYHSIKSEKAGSYESHLVHNFLNDHNLPDSYKQRFHKINGYWPPSKDELGSLLLDANRFVSERDHAVKS
jgi:Na+/H+ antiporter NhaB